MQSSIAAGSSSLYQGPITLLTVWVHRKGQVLSQQASRVGEMKWWLDQHDATGNWQSQRYCTSVLESNSLLSFGSVFSIWRMWSVAGDPAQWTGNVREVGKFQSFIPGMCLEHAGGWPLFFCRKIQPNHCKWKQMNENHDVFSGMF